MGRLTESLHRWKNGDETAQFDLIHELQPLLAELLDLVHRRRNPRFNARIDTGEVVYAALKSFLSGSRNDRFELLNNTEDARKILFTLVTCALVDRVEFHQAQRRSPDRETGTATDIEKLTGFTDRATSIVELVDELMFVAERTDPCALDVLRLSIEGASNPEIADSLLLTVRKVQLIKQQMHRNLQERLKE